MKTLIIHVSNHVDFIKAFFKERSNKTRFSVENFKNFQKKNISIQKTFQFYHLGSNAVIQRNYNFSTNLLRLRSIPIPIKLYLCSFSHCFKSSQNFFHADLRLDRLFEYCLHSPYRFEVCNACSSNVFNVN